LEHYKIKDGTTILVKLINFRHRRCSKLSRGKSIKGEQIVKEINKVDKRVNANGRKRKPK
jgi:hypothetical protein